MWYYIQFFYVAYIHVIAYYSLHPTIIVRVSNLGKIKAREFGWHDLYLQPKT